MADGRLTVVESGAGETRAENVADETQEENVAGTSYDPIDADGDEQFPSDWEDIDDNFGTTDDGTLQISCVVTKSKC